MPINQLSILYAKYIPAELRYHKSTGWLLVYRAYNPATNELELCRVRLNRLRKKHSSLLSFKRFVRQMIADLNTKLQAGWSPFIRTDFTARMYEPIADVINKYLDDRAKELRKATLRTYESALRFLTRWLDQKIPECKCCDFRDIHAVEFMETRLQSGISAVTYNSTLKAMNAFFLWCKKHKYVLSNPFEGITERREEQKQRDVIPLEDLSIIRQYFEERCPGYVLVMLLIYFGGLRPQEITRIRVNQVHLTARHIYMPGSSTKTHAPRKAPLSTELIGILSTYLVGSKPDDYLIGAEYVPSSEPCTVKSMERRWRKMREKLNMPKEYQLYSLRDCSAHYRLSSSKLGPLDTMHGLGHKQLSQTLVYADHEIRDLASRLEEGTPKF